ncbi:MAG TPA: hypothetical protein VMS45_01530, partial [Gemmatimonadaceae bacterium]|nr:hypothetical protein [Gemmatimonadaceae bacterium]
HRLRREDHVPRAGAHRQVADQREAHARDLQVARVRLALIRDLPVSTSSGNVILTTQTVNSSGVPQTQAVVLPGSAQANPFGVTP